MAHLVRLAVFFLTFALAIVGLGAGANAFAKSNEQKAFVKAHSPIPGVSVDTHDIFSLGLVLLIGLGGLVITSLIAMLTTLFTVSFIPSILEGLAFALASLWIFPCAIANTVISRTRSAQVFAGGQKLSDSVVQQVSSNFGISPRYWSNGYVRFYAIVTWVVLLFAVLSTFVSFSTRPKKHENKV